jgi:hypothetical protein
MRAFLLILFFSWLSGLYFPWWSALIPCLLLGAWLLQNPGTAFITGFAAVGLAWLIQALYIHIASDGILTHRIAELMQTGSPAVVIGITFSIGAVIGGFGTLTGYYFKKAFIE